MRRDKKSGLIRECLGVGFFTILALVITVRNSQGITHAAANGYDVVSGNESVSGSDKNQDLNNEEQSVLIKSLQRDGGIDLGGLILASEPVVYRIQMKEYDDISTKEAVFGKEAEGDGNSSVGMTVSGNEGSASERVGDILEDGADEEGEMLNYKIGGIEGKVPMQDGYAQLIFEEDTSELLQVWYAAEGEVYLYQIVQRTELNKG